MRGPHVDCSFSRAFTLMELLVSVGLVGILLSVTLVAINPSVQFTRAHDAKRQSDITQLFKALLQYETDNQGTNPPNTPTNDQTGPVYIANQSGTGIDLCSILVPKYLPALPIDPVLNSDNITICGGDYNTGYSVLQDTNGKFSVYADGAVPRIIAGASTDIPYLLYRLDSTTSSMDSTGVSTYRIPAANIVAAPINSGAGKYGDALVFSGAGQYIGLTSPADQIFSAGGQSGFSLSAWIKTSGSGTRMIYAERNAHPSTIYRIVLYLDSSNQVIAAVKTDDLTGTPTASVTSGPIVPDTWYHVELTYAWNDPSTALDDSTQKLILYVNGASVVNVANPTNTISFPSTTSAGTFAAIGASPWGADFFSGSLDDLRIYRYARTGPEVQNDMHNLR